MKRVKLFIAAVLMHMNGLKALRDFSNINFWFSGLAKMNLWPVLECILRYLFCQYVSEGFLVRSKDFYAQWS